MTKVFGGMSFQPGQSSSDPNEKVGPGDNGSSRYIRGTDPIPYTIFFENLSSTTAPAAEVIVTDQLDPNLDLSTFNLRAIRFGVTTIQVPEDTQNLKTFVDLRPIKNLLVRINTQLAAGLLTVRLTAIDSSTGQPPTDALAGFLPPNRNSPEGEGSVFYTIMPKNDLMTGSEIKNTASIVFDTNAAIVTAEWVNVIDKAKPESHVLPLPPIQTTPQFTVAWAGSDIGAGIKDYTVFVSAEGGEFTPFIRDTRETSAVFAGKPGIAYSFYSIARDFAGNLEDVPTSPDVVTQVRVAPVPGDINSDGKVDCADLSIVRSAFGKKSGHPGFDSRADINRDQFVDVRDLAFVAQKLPAGVRCQ